MTQAVAAQAWSVEIVPPASGAAMQSAGDLQALENRLQRQQFQQQQQQFRQEDRQIAPPQRPEVPAMRRNCQVQVYGNTYVTSCR